jgi:hypothetical protein
MYNKAASPAEVSFGAFEKVKLYKPGALSRCLACDN